MNRPRLSLQLDDLSRCSIIVDDVDAIHAIHNAIDVAARAGDHVVVTLQNSTVIGGTLRWTDSHDPVVRLGRADMGKTLTVQYMGTAHISPNVMGFDADPQVSEAKVDNGDWRAVVTGIDRSREASRDCWLMTVILSDRSVGVISIYDPAHAARIEDAISDAIQLREMVTVVLKGFVVHPVVQQEYGSTCEHQRFYAPCARIRRASCFNRPLIVRAGNIPSLETQFIGFTDDQGNSANEVASGGIRAAIRRVIRPQEQKQWIAHFVLADNAVGSIDLNDSQQGEVISQLVDRAYGNGEVVTVLMYNAVAVPHH
jgi:hypothetical protein